VVIYVTVRNLSLEKPCLQPEVCFVCAVAVESPPPPRGGRSRGLLVVSLESLRAGEFKKRTFKFNLNLQV